MNEKNEIYAVVGGSFANPNNIIAIVRGKKNADTIAEANSPSNEVIAVHELKNWIKLKLDILQSQIDVVKKENEELKKDTRGLSYDQRALVSKMRGVFYEDQNEGF